jgi:CubicO group peptidase (beta-lactamase class C family)
MRLLIILLLLLPCAVWSQLPAAEPESVGISSDRLARLDPFVQKYIDEGRLNGTVGIILRDGKIVYHKAYGQSNMEKKSVMQKDHIFRIASMTKPIVSVAVMMLWEEGKFSLDDPISKFIPAFKKTQVLDRYNPKDTTFTTLPAKREITIRHLLAHTSGIGYAQIGSPYANAIYKKYNINGGIGTPHLSLKQVIPRIAELPLFNQPGEKFLYGLNTDVLGYLVEVISGMPLDTFLRQRIFEPLGMKDTYFYLPAEKQSRLVKLYKQDDNGKISPYNGSLSVEGDPDYPLAKNGEYFSGGAGLSSTAYDYALFCQMLINGGTLNNKRLLSPHTIELMTTNQIGKFLMWDNADEIRQFGLGFGLYLEKAKAALPIGEGSYTWGGMFATHFWIDPKNKLVVVFLRNLWPTQDWDFEDRIKPVIYQALSN